MTPIPDFKESERHVPSQPAPVDDNQPPLAQSAAGGLLGAILDDADTIDCARNMVELADFSIEEKASIAAQEGRIERDVPYGIPSRVANSKRNKMRPASRAQRSRE